MADDEALDVLKFRTGDGSEWKLVGWKKVETWLEDLAAANDWIQTFRGHDPSNMRGNTGPRSQQLRDEAASLRAAGRPPAAMSDAIQRMLMDGYAPPHPRGERGKAIAAIRKVAGDEAALFALGVLGNVSPPGQMQTTAHLRGATLAVSPEILALTDDTAQLKAERKRFSEAIERFEAETEEVALARDRTWEANLKRAGEVAKDWHKRRVRRWLRYASTARRREVSAVESIKSVESAYREQMGLAAPVEYWKTKARQHRKSEGQALAWVLLYFPIALSGMGTAFYLTGRYLIETATAPLAEGSQPMPSAIFIVASAGLASCAGLVFWVGRLLTKLYLSQHHLRQDADERATMTETYLALIENSAASTDDRQVILNALFRNTPDGIVKEDGGLDPSIAAALGKFLAKP